MVKLGTLGALAFLAIPVPAARSAVPTQKSPDISVKAVVAAGTKYVADYAARMMFVVGDEAYSQDSFDADDHRTASRSMKGELFLTFLKADHAWVAVRDVAEVDGEPVPDRQTLPALLARGALSSIVVEVVEHNAAFNLGHIERTFNEPTLPLLVLDARRVSNFSFTRQQVEVADGVTLVTLAFVERERPTLVMSGDGVPFFARGELLMEAGTGRVRATHILFKGKSITADLRTTYVPDPRLELWLPSLFTERYEGAPGGVREVDTGRAEYSNFKRYEAVGRIKR